jgi:hypothetical protein
VKKYDAAGAVLQVGDGDPNGTGELFTAVAGLTDFGAPEISVEERDRTDHDSPNGAKEFGPGWLDGGSISLEGFYDPAEPTQGGTTGLVYLATNRITRNWKIVLTDDAASTVTFRGFLTGFSVGLPHDGDMTFSASAKITGLPTYPA